MRDQEDHGTNDSKSHRERPREAKLPSAGPTNGGARQPKTEGAGLGASSAAGPRATETLDWGLGGGRPLRKDPA